MILEVYIKSDVFGTGEKACKIDRADKLIAYTSGMGVFLVQCQLLCTSH